MYVLLTIILLLLFIALYLYARTRRERFKPTYQGICYFDIDGTITDASGNRDEMVQQCLDRNFAVGVITASKRRPEDVCDGIESRVRWMPQKLCQFMAETDCVTYNSAAPVLAGQGSKHYNFPIWYPYAQSPGWVKGFAMNHGRKLLQIPDSQKVLLFDDDAYYLRDVQRYAQQVGVLLTTVCAGANCSRNGTRRLTNEVVEKALDQVTKSASSFRTTEPAFVASTARIAPESIDDPFVSATFTERRFQPVNL